MPANRLFLFAAALITSTAFLVTGCGGDDDEDWKGETIRIGSIFSTTGESTAFGPQQVLGAQLAVNELNADDGINGATVELRQMNDAGEPKNSAWAMKMLIDNFDAISVLGPTFSNSAAVADPIANERKTPVVAVSNTGPGIVGDCPYACEFIFRDSLGEEDAIPANVDSFVQGAGLDSGVALVLHPQGDPFGKSTAKIAAGAFRDNGMQVLGVQAVPAGGIGAWRDIKLDAVMITASSGEVAANLIKEVRKLDRKVPILGGNAFNSTTASEEAGAAGKGARSAAAWFEGNTSEENQEFIAAYRATYDREPDQFAAQAYTGALLLAEAIEDADLTFDDIAADRELVRTALEKVEEETPLGNFKFTADHDVNQPVWIVEMNGAGTFDLVEEVPPPQ